MKRVLMIAMGRSGSTVTMKYIKQLLGQNDRGLELLNYNSGEEHFGLDQHGNEKIGKYDARLGAGIINKDSIKFGRLLRHTADYRYELQRRFENLKAFGWPSTKVLSEDWRLLPPHQREEMNNSYDIVLTMDRRDFTEGAVSTFYAIYQNKWHRDHGQNAFDVSTSIRLHPKAIKRYIDEYNEYCTLVSQLTIHTAHLEYEILFDVKEFQRILSTFCRLPFNKDPKLPLLKGQSYFDRRNSIMNYDHLKIIEKQYMGEKNVTYIPRTGIDN